MSHKIPLRAGCCYHIFNHANGFENLFVRPGNYDYFLKKYAQHIAPVADTFAYCLMPNHFHLLVRIKPWEQLAEQWTLSAAAPDAERRCALQVSKCFGNLFSPYAQAFNQQQNRRGNLFISNFKRKAVAIYRTGRRDCYAMKCWPFLAGANLTWPRITWRRRTLPCGHALIS